MFCDFIYLEKLRSKLLVEVGQILNKFHNTNYSNRYWEILIGNWVHSFCLMIFDKWEVISDLNKIDKNFKLNLKKFSDKDMIVQSIDELNNLYYINDFNSYYLSEILNYRFASTDKFVINFALLLTCSTISIFSIFCNNLFGNLVEFNLAGIMQTILSIS